MATQRKLSAGPSKFDLMMSLFEGKRITFTVEGIGPQEIQITCVESEDGSHESWNIQGALTQRNWQKFTGYFDTRNRRGFINSDFEEQQAPEQKPKVGDPAYTRYHGRKKEGILTYLDNHGRGVIEPADPNVDWGWLKHGYCIVGNEERAVRGLFAGYDEPIVWDAAAGMWYAPANHD